MGGAIYFQKWRSLEVNVKLKAAIPDNDGLYDPIKKLENRVKDGFLNLNPLILKQLREQINNDKIPVSLLEHVFSTVFH